MSLTTLRAALAGLDRRGFECTNSGKLVGIFFWAALRASVGAGLFFIALSLIVRWLTDAELFSQEDWKRYFGYGIVVFLVPVVIAPVWVVTAIVWGKLFPPKSKDQRQDD